MVKALSHIHSYAMHRDVKPENMLISKLAIKGISDQ